MLRWQELVHQPEGDLARLDIAAVNLACADGLPGSDRIGWDRCGRTLVGWVESCRRFTAGVMPHFHAGRGDYPDSEPKFRIQAMVTHLQRDLGVRYHPDRMAEDAVFQPEDSFVHGVIQGQGGTCGNLPVVYAAVGRRLGYPIRLATTKGHLYCRWDDGQCGESFNIEATSKGVNYHPDEYYRTGRYTTPAETIEAWGFLESKSPREELAGFLSQRAGCWMRERDYRQAAVAFAWAHELDPRREQYAFLTRQALQVWREGLNRELPDARHMPPLDLRLPSVAQFQRLPNGVELDLIGLTVTQRLMDDPLLDVRWWIPLKANPTERPAGLPARMPAEYRWTGPDSGVTIFPTLPWC